MASSRKTCTKCGEAKTLSEFYNRSDARDGHETRCKTCAKKEVLAYLHSPEALPLRRLRIARYMKTDKGKQAIRRYRGSEKDKATRRRYRQSNKTKINARARVFTAIKYGHLPHPSLQPCHICGQPATEYHHSNGYDGINALVVVALCFDCHRSIPLIR